MAGPPHRQQDARLLALFQSELQLLRLSGAAADPLAAAKLRLTAYQRMLDELRRRRASPLAIGAFALLVEESAGEVTKLEVAQAHEREQQAAKATARQIVALLAEGGVSSLSAADVLGGRLPLDDDDGQQDVPG